MRGLVCLGDATTHGGNVITASSTMYVNGVQVALVGDLVSCPHHGNNAIIEGEKNTTDNGRAVVVNNCTCECGCKVISSQSNSIIEE
ncbi:PAAR domain-containing protein [Xenorhabdus sp. 42]|uniref:PAAR domain-containing protein n=1 Tax=Xenorhabdus szentirmaii TaxID=290112 RepID=UPI0019B4A1E9|nr:MULTISPECIES: PAAR domain-containing protein [unclassified Xenorhabdus]MBD2792119.1 PAAR domain-containing protein [Xenorhabdus sp. CUL]MBD2822681.1 PAAR domain-containing protein [Xenorhabdus sp. 42]